MSSTFKRLSNDTFSYSQIQPSDVNGLVDGSNKILASLLPSYIDIVEEFANYASFPASGVSQTIYVDTSTNLCWRWSGTQYVQIASNASSLTSGTVALTQGGCNADVSSGTAGQILIKQSGSSYLPQSITSNSTNILINATASGITAGFTASGGSGLLHWSGTVATSSICNLASDVGGSILTCSNGGIGISSFSIGDIMYASGTTALAKLSDVATGNALISGGVGVAPSYGKIGLTTHISGTLAVSSGGTNITSFSIGDIMYASASTTLAKLADVATGSALISGGVGVAPSYGKIGLTTHISGTLGCSNGGTNCSTLPSSIGQILISQTGNNAYTPANITATGTGNISITNGSGTINIDTVTSPSFSSTLSCSTIQGYTAGQDISITPQYIAGGETRYIHMDAANSSTKSCYVTHLSGGGGLACNGGTIYGSQYSGSQFSVYVGSTDVTGSYPLTFAYGATSANNYTYGVTGSYSILNLKNDGSVRLRQTGGLIIPEGSNCRMGTSTLASGTVTVSNTSVTTSTRIFLSVQSLGGTEYGAVKVSARVASTSFTITSYRCNNTTTVASGDASVIAWQLIEAGTA